MRRTGVRTVRRRCQTWCATIHSGIEDQVSEDQKESLQTYRSSEGQLACLECDSRQVDPEDLCTAFANWRTSSFLDLVNYRHISDLRLASGLHSPDSEGIRNAENRI